MALFRAVARLHHQERLHMGLRHITVVVREHECVRGKCEGGHLPLCVKVCGCERDDWFDQRFIGCLGFPGHHETKLKRKYKLIKKQTSVSKQELHLPAETLASTKTCSLHQSKLPCKDRPSKSAGLSYSQKWLHKATTSECEGFQ